MHFTRHARGACYVGAVIGFLIQWFVTAVAVFVAAHLVPGVDYHGNYGALAVVALILGILNALLRTFKLILGILTLGILTLLINALLFWLVGSVVKGFTVDGFWSAFFGALIVSFVSLCLNVLIGPRKKLPVHPVNAPPSRPTRRDDVIDV